jgi:hypothetical protein
MDGQQAPPAQCHPSPVGRDRKQPRAEPGRVREPPQAEECMDGGFLNDVLCVLACTYQSPAQPPHTRLPPQQQPPERVAVAGQHRPDQLGIIARIVVHHSFCCTRQTDRSRRAGGRLWPSPPHDGAHTSAGSEPEEAAAQRTSTV